MNESKSAPTVLFGAVVLLNIILFLNCLRLFYQNAPEVLASSCDTGWIVKTGEYILQHMSIPTHDIFTWTNASQPFVAYQWLFEVFCALLFNAGGIWLVGATCYVLSGLLYLFLLPLIWQRFKLPLFLSYASLSLVLTPWWFNARPQLISYFLILFFIAILEKNRQKPTKLILILPAAMILWANTHSFWSVGLIIVAVYTIVAVLKRRAQFPLLIAVCVTTFASILVNPYGWNLARHIISFADNEQWMGVWEVLPSYLSPDFKYYFAYLVIMWMTLVRARKAVPPEHYLLCAIATVASICVRRYETVAVFMTWPCFGLALSNTFQVKHFIQDMESWSGGFFNELLTGRWFTTTGRSIIAALVLIILSLAFWSYQFPNERRALAAFCNYGDESLLYFTKNFKNEHDFFSDPATGSWLLLLGAAPVFIDTRYDMYPKQFCQSAIFCVAGADGWNNYLQKNNVRVVVLRNIAAGLSQKLRTSKDWYVLMDDGVVSLYLRSTYAPEVTQRLHMTDQNLPQSTLARSTVQRTLFARHQQRKVSTSEL